MAPEPPTIDRLLNRSSQARLSELLNIVVQGMQAIEDEFGGSMGPNGQGWDDLLNLMPPGSTGSGPPPNFATIAGPTDSDMHIQSTTEPAPVDPESGASSVHKENPAPVPAAAKHGKGLAPTRPNTSGTAAIPAASTPQKLTAEQRSKEWGLIVHYMDVRAKMTVDQLAHAHAAFKRWFGWAPTREQMKMARQAARSPYVLTGIHGPWCTPLATEVWLKAVRDLSIARLKELKVSDWEKASRIAAFVGVRLKKEDRPRQDGRPEREPVAKRAAAAEGEAEGEGKGANSLVVKLKMKAGSFPQEPAQSWLQDRTQLQYQSQLQDQPQLHDQSQLQNQFQLQDQSQGQGPSNAIPADCQNLPMPIYWMGAQQPQIAPAQQQLDLENDLSGYIQRTLPNGLHPLAPNGVPAMANNFGIDPSLTINQYPMSVQPGFSNFSGQPMNPMMFAQPQPISAYPVQTPAASNGANPFQWIVERATTLARSLTSSQDQIGVPTQPDEDTTVSFNDMIRDTVGVVDVGPATAECGGPADADADADAEDDNGAGPSEQLFNEMIMHSSPRDEERTKNKQELGEEQAQSSSGREQQQQQKQTAKPARAFAAKATAKALTRKRKPHAPIKPYYNYSADVTPDPRANALIAYILAAWHVSHKTKIATDTVAMERLKKHATAAMPAVLHDSQTGITTLGLFRWGDEELAWEVTLARLDIAVKKRAQQKKEVEKISPGKDAPAAAKSDGLAGTNSSTSADAQQPVTTTDTAPLTSTVSSTPTITTSTTMPPRPPRSSSSRQRAPYPDSSIVAISELTPDSRANAFAAYLAKTFYRDHGVDLMADEAGRHRLMMHATRNEHRVRGAKETENYEMNFHAEKDLAWKITGFRLDALEQEWVTRFPPPEESEGEEDKDDDGSEAEVQDIVESEVKTEDNSESDVEMGGVGDDDKQQHGSQSEVQQHATIPVPAPRHPSSTAASSALSSVPPTSPEQEDASPASSSSDNHSASVSPKRLLPAGSKRKRSLPSSSSPSEADSDAESTAAVADTVTDPVTANPDGSLTSSFASSSSSPPGRQQPHAKKRRLLASNTRSSQQLFSSAQRRRCRTTSASASASASDPSSLQTADARVARAATAAPGLGGGGVEMMMTAAAPPSNPRRSRRSVSTASTRSWLEDMGKGGWVDETGFGGGGDVEGGVEE
ncbi:hypothetical protein SLS58_005378 [Diplodia intermedia]|uniref:Uncharacterized protein n=1 Tax=Diplodia intermedia TaxID=856260 RepID=A0ABR3TQU1_9PEZI